MLGSKSLQKKNSRYPEAEEIANCPTVGDIKPTKQGKKKKKGEPTTDLGEKREERKKPKS